VAVRVGAVSPGSTESKYARGVPSANREHYPAALRARPSKQRRAGALYSSEHLPAREIERLLGVSHTGVLEALDRVAISGNGNGRKRTGQLPFGFDYVGYQLVKNGVKQAAIRMMRKYRAGGLSLREIAGDLNL
jgi:hypothetical protein